MDRQTLSPFFNELVKIAGEEIKAKKGSDGGLLHTAEHKLGHGLGEGVRRLPSTKWGSRVFGLRKLFIKGSSYIDDLEAPPSSSLMPALRRAHGLAKRSSWTEIGPQGQSEGRAWKSSKLPWIRDKLAAASIFTGCTKLAEPGPPPGVPLKKWDKILQGEAGSQTTVRKLVKKYADQIRAAARKDREKRAEIRDAVLGDFKRFKIKDINLKRSLHGGEHKVKIDISPEGKFRGLAAAEPASGKNSGLYVAPPYRRQGIASRLLDSFEVPPTRTRQRLGHKPSRTFYEKQGFRGTGQIEDDPKYGRMEWMEREKKAYKLQGHINFQGIPISIENRKGSVRKGKDSDGKEWRTKMRASYGYITGGPKGADDEPVDVYVGPDKNAPDAYVVHQHKDTGKGYDEDKAMIGFSSKAAAKAAFLAHYNSPKFLGPISKVPIDRLKELVASKRKLVKIAAKSNTPAAAYQRKIQSRFGRLTKALETQEETAGTKVKRILIPKKVMGERDLKQLGFAPATISIPEAGQTRFKSFRHPQKLFHLHEHGDAWIMHKDKRPAKGLQAVPHVITEGVSGAYHYLKGRIKRIPSMRERVEKATSSEYKRHVKKWKALTDK